MEYVQERVTTLHDFGGAAPDAPTDRTAVVVPLTERDHAGMAAADVFETLSTVGPERVIVPLRASPERVDAVVEWLSTFDLPLSVLWCDGPRLTERLAAAGLNGTRGKGRDVWLALGVAADSEYVVVHDADATTYTAAHVPRLLYPLSHGRSFSKGYYARVENDGLYGRLFRLFVRPLLSTLEAETDAAICEYLAAFRYALAGEFAMTGDLARRMRIQRRWGLEIGTLGEAFRLAGTDDTAQIDLGIHRHDHRSVSGPSGLSEMAEQVGEALFRAVEENGPTPDYETLPERYRSTADRLVDAYELDAGFNDLSFDAADERRQVETYADAIAAPGVDDRLPAWDDAPLSVATIVDDVSADLAEAREG